MRGHGHPGRARLLIFLLVASHAAVFLISRGSRGITAGETEGAADAAGASSPTKSTAREEGAGGGLAQRFSRLLRELEQSDLDDEEFAAARVELFREWIRLDLRSAVDRLFSPESYARYEGISDVSDTDRNELLGTEFAAQSRTVWDWIATRRHGIHAQELFDYWLEAVVKDGQLDLVLEVLPGTPPFATYDATQAICKKANAAQLTKLRGVMANSEALMRAGTIDFGEGTTYAQRLLELANGEILPLIAAESDPELRSELAKAWSAGEVRHLPAAVAVQALLILPEDLRRDAAMDLVTQERTGGMADTARLLEGLAAQGMLGETGSYFENEVVLRAVRQQSYDRLSDFSVSFQSLSSIGRPDLRRTALQALGQRTGADYLLDKLGSLPAGQDRDALLEGAITKPTSDPDERERLLGAIGDPALAEELRKKLEKE